MTLSGVLLVCAGGALGAVARYWISRVGALAMPEASFPLPTLFVNITGSALLGAVVALLEPDMTSLVDAPMMLFGGVGFCGAYTTFSSFCTETVALVSESRRLALTYVITTVAGAIAAFISTFSIV